MSVVAERREVAAGGAAWAPAMSPFLAAGACAIVAAAEPACLAGTLVAAPLIVSAGGVLLVAALCLFSLASLGGAASPGWARRIYLGLVVVLLVSMPIGLVPAWLRA